jgi:hypothetical protein
MRSAALGAVGTRRALWPGQSNVCQGLPEIYSEFIGICYTLGTAMGMWYKAEQR